MNILIVHPEYENKKRKLFKTFSKKPNFPPKELILISTLLPITWERKRVDLNYDKLNKKDIFWADYVFVSACEKQQVSAIDTIKFCNSLGRPVIACGSLFTEYFEEFEHVEHLALDDIRKTLPLLIYDLETEKPQKVYHSNPFYEIKRIARPYFSLRGISEEFSKSIQFSQA